MSSNGIHDEGAIAVSSALRLSSKIKTLNLRANRITFYGVYKLIDALEPVLHCISSALAESINEREPAKAKGFDDTQSVSTKLSVRENLDISVDAVDESVGEGTSQVIQDDNSPAEIYNETLHTLWLRHNDDVPDELLKIVDTILAKRFPQPPPGISKKKKKTAASKQKSK
ncbi:putative leucine-rich repeat protein (LRRP) [Trypanosoma grayi]|uniref:putative leucine-rich repeat protein (LRRP) n=1 Tax=Trypanosoma grayi TaxID=71804 RepID=UPI0004F4823F|nr:putative leucine-rich repeat protein (LRRP) [Trypanosoma grayi]KEG12170.1 putative leucine-rich repeat protein (LRRP) [Trypanosoma grayi]